MKHLSFDKDRVEQGHELRQYWIGEKQVDRSRLHRPDLLAKAMEQRGIPLQQGLQKESPMDIAHPLISLSDRAYPGLPKFDPGSPELSDYEAARMSDNVIGSQRNYQIGHARHLAAYRSGEYEALLESSEALPELYRGFVRAEVLNTMAEKEQGNKSKTILGLDVNSLRYDAVAAYQASMEAGLPYVMPEILSEYLRLLDQKEPVVNELIGLVQRTVHEQLSPDKSTPIGIVEGIFNRDVYVIEGLQAMEWLIENGVPEAARSFVNGFWAEVGTSFRDPRVDPRKCDETVNRLLARAKALDPHSEKPSYAWLVN